MSKTLAPYHPASNGKAEQFVLAVKAAVTAFYFGQHNMQAVIDDFLFANHNEPHSMPRLCLAKLFLTQAPALSAIRPRAVKVWNLRARELEGSRGDNRRGLGVM